MSTATLVISLVAAGASLVLFLAARRKSRKAKPAPDGVLVNGFWVATPEQYVATRYDYAGSLSWELTRCTLHKTPLDWMRLYAEYETVRVILHIGSVDRAFDATVDDFSVDHDGPRMLTLRGGTESVTIRRRRL